MQFLQYELGNVNSGEVLEVILKGNAAYVRLMDADNFDNYKKGQQCNFYGGLVTRSPYRMAIPYTNYWYAAIDLGGNAGQLQASVKIVPGKVGVVKQAPLSSVSSLLLGRNDSLFNPHNSGRAYDVFVLYAAEDKNSVAKSMIEALENVNLRVWLEKTELKNGDNLLKLINRVYTRCNFGIVIITRAFLQKKWADSNIDEMITKATSGEQILLPVWHDVTKQEIQAYSPALADKISRNTATNTLAEIAAEVSVLIHNNRK